MVTKTGPASPTSARMGRAISVAGDRYRTRREVWRAAEGDPDRYRQLMTARLGAGYIHYDDDQPRPSEWLRLRRRLGRWALTGGVAIAVVLAMGLTPLVHHPWVGVSPRMLDGLVTIVDTASAAEGSCAGDGDLADIAEGASVTVIGAQGETLAVTTLGAGVQVGQECRLPIRRVRVPGRSWYRVQVGRQPAMAVAVEEIGRLAIRLGS